jgi:hypothetical protein
MIWLEFAITTVCAVLGVIVLIVIANELNKLVNLLRKREDDTRR